MAEDQNQHKILTTSDNDDKKMIRREVEKQRRMQMSILCSSLRSSIPFDLIKVFNLLYFLFDFILFINMMLVIIHIIILYRSFHNIFLCF